MCVRHELGVPYTSLLVSPCDQTYELYHPDLKRSPLYPSEWSPFDSGTRDVADAYLPHGQRFPGQRGQVTLPDIEAVTPDPGHSSYPDDKERKIRVNCTLTGELVRLCQVESVPPSNTMPYLRV